MDLTAQQIIGLRVVRGPDWSWSNQDEGEGHVGTIVEVGSPGQMSPERTVVVYWDHGLKTNYRVGYHHAFDLRIFDNGPVGVEHGGSLCCACETRDIKGFKWRCTRCLVDLCSRCYFMDCHDVKHQFFRFDHFQSSGILCPQRVGSTRATAKGIFAGAKVVRGPDWDWHDQDGGDGQQGKVQEIRGWEDETYRSVANVTWPNGISNVYRIGHKGKVDLKYIKSSKGGNYYPDHLPVVDLSNMPVTPQTSTLSSNISPVTFVLGERVKVSLELELLKVMQEGHGGWNPKMNDVIDRIGCVHRITEKGDVRVIYDNGVKWTFHHAALTKVPLFQTGDSVVVTKNVAHLLEQVSDREEASAIAGCTGIINVVKPDGTFEVSIRNKNFVLHVNCLQPAIAGRSGMMSSYNPGTSNQSGPSTVTPFGDRMNPPVSPECEKLFVALKKCDQNTVMALLEKDSNLSCILLPDGKQPLHHAVLLDSIGMLKYLLDLEQVDVNAYDSDRNTVLHLATVNTNIDVLKTLLSHESKQVEINKQDQFGQTALSVAIAIEDDNVAHKVDLLLSKNADPNIADFNGETAVFRSICLDKSDVAIKFLNMPNVDYKMKTLKDLTYLHLACSKGNLKVCEKLFELCPDLINVIDKNTKFSPLHLAVYNNKESVVHFLLDKGANVNHLSNKRINALMFAVCCSNLGVISKLISAGTNLNHLDIQLNNCLSYLFITPPNITKLTCYNKSELNEEFTEIESLLSTQYSEINRDALVACYLISRGVKYKGIKNKSGQSPLQLCPDQDLVNIIENFVKENTCETTCSADCRMCSKPSSCQFKPCDHVISCEECVDYFKRCPVCKKEVESYKKLSITIQKICIVCDDLEANIRFEPCNHNLVCHPCAVRMKKCITCQTVITSKVDLLGNDVTKVTPPTFNNTESDPSRIGPDEIAQLRTKLEQLEDAALCQICIERPKNVVFLCGHTFCQMCAMEMSLCPCCRQRVSSMIPIYSG